MKRPNLNVVTDALVDQARVDGRRATGIEIITRSRTRDHARTT